MKITPSENKVRFDKLESLNGGSKDVANVRDVVMDKEFVEKLRHDWCWLGYESMPTEMGWYRVDRAAQELIKISEKQASELEWHERLFIYESALGAAKEQSYLALYIGDEYADNRLSALYLCGPDVLAWLAQK